MKKLEKCPVTKTLYPPAEGMEGHIFPEVLGGKTRTRTWKKIDNKVGSDFDSVLEKQVERMATGRLCCKITMQGILQGGIKKDATTDRFFKNIRATIPDSVERILVERLNATSASNFPFSLQINVLDEGRMLLSLVHSAILFIARGNPRRSGNLTFFQNMLVKGLHDFEAISDAEWDEIKLRCIFSIPGEAVVNRNKINSKSSEYDTVLIPYRHTKGDGRVICYGLCRLHGTFKKYPHGKIPHLFILEK